MTSVFLNGQIVAIPDEVVTDMEKVVQHVQSELLEFPSEAIEITDAAARLETFLRDIKEAASQDQDTTI